MTSVSSDASGISQIIENAIEQNPHAGELLRAFKPVIVRQRQLAKAAMLMPADYSRVDKEKLKAGIPIIRQADFLDEADDIKQIILPLAEALKEGMPAVTEGIDRFCTLAQEGKIVLTDYFKTPEEGQASAVDKWGADLKLSPSNAAFLMSLAGRVILEQRRNEAVAALGAFDWEKGYCPICGDFPSIALIEEEGGTRFLHCSSCGQDWRFTRVCCPYCEKDSRQGMDYFYVENKTQESAFICDECKKYLVTLYRVGHILPRDMDVSAIALVHLDMIMQDKGYEPMTVCAWNVLG
ncbi:MAG: formate dehydrogenase accessory protein FdhE [Smithella sp.]|jgi:FdhE protein|nr:formate dehydrogenase accessory protein FdhE [Smithella sp.]